MRSVLLVTALGACGFQPGRLAGDGGDEPDASADAGLDAIVLGAWGPATVVTLPAPTATDDDPTLTDDRREMYVNSARAGNADIYVVTRSAVTEAWPTPLLVAELSTTSNETTPEVSADGLTMILSSDRAGTLGLGDLWISTRGSRSAAWPTPMRIPELATTTNEAAGNMTPDGRLMVFSSERTGNGSPDLFYAERTSPAVAWQAAIEIAAVNTTNHEGSPQISADGLTLYFDTNRDGTFAIYTSHRASRGDPFPAPTRIVEIDTSFAEADPWISLDERRLMFVSDRGGINELWEATR